MENQPQSIEKIIELKFANLAPGVWKALADLKRTGWVKRGVENPESVQEHTISLLKLASSFEDLSDTEKDGLLEMLEVHDWPEALHGDEAIITKDPEERARLKAIKFDKEHEALKTICGPLGVSGDKILNLWLRFEKSPDEAATFARQLDKYQAIEKAFEYEKSQGLLLFKKFYDGDIERITHPILVERLDDMMVEWKTLSINSSNK